jgi:hypothetical protein
MKRYRTTKSYTMCLDAQADAIFPLLCPVREFDWIQPWQCEMVYTDSGRAELDCVFKTNFPDDGPEDTWVISRYEMRLLQNMINHFLKTGEMLKIME